MAIMGLYLTQFTPRPGATAVSGHMISTAIALQPFLVPDGERWDAQPFYASYSDPDTLLALPEGYVLASFELTLTQEDQAALTGPTIVQPSSLVSYSDLLTMRIQAAATHPDAPDIFFDQTVLGQGVHTAPVATAGSYFVEVVKDAPAVFVPWTVLFEPAIEEREIGSISGSLSNAPAGVRVLPGGLEFDPSVLVEQDSTGFSVIAQNSNPTPSDPKSISVTVLPRIVSLTVPLRIDQGFAGGHLLELTNREEALDLGNWSGHLPGDYVIFGASRDGVSIDPLAVSSRLMVGERYQISAALWANGTGPSQGGVPKLVVTSEDMVVQDWLFVADPRGDGSEWRLEIEDGPPDHLEVHGLIIDGRPNDPGLTVGMLRLASSAMLETHQAPMPICPPDPVSGDLIGLPQSVVVGPHTAEISREVALLRDGVVAETGIGLTRPLVAADDNASLQIQITDQAPGLGPLQGMSAAKLVQLAEPGYSARRFATDGTVNLVGEVPPNMDEFLVAGSLERVSLQFVHLWNVVNGSGSYIRPLIGGGVSIRVYDSAGEQIYDAGCTDVYDAEGLTHVAYKFGFTATGSVLQVVKNGVDISDRLTISRALRGTGIIQSGPAGLLGRRFGSWAYIGQFEDLVVQFGAGGDALALYQANPAEIGGAYVIGGPDQRALPLGASETPNINAGQHSGTAADLTFDETVTSGLEPISEVV